MIDNQPKYYLNINGTNVGPLTLDQLRAQNITPDTYVWRKGLAEWQRASSFPELAPLFADVPPATPPYGMPPKSPAGNPSSYGTGSPYNPSMPSPGDPMAPRPPMPKTWLVESILATIFCCLPFGIVSIVYSSKVESSYWSGRYDMAKVYSDKARTWFWASVITAAVVTLIYFVCIVFPLLFTSL